MPRSLAQVLDLDNSTTRAVVIGISDYQAPAIPDLQFADRDANAFAEWLRSPAGGSVPETNITLLTNAEATGGKFAMALTGLIDECKPGEHAIIYFSGHGDVETKTVFQLGFLLCHDSPASNYMGGGFNLVNLQAVISTLAANGVQTLVVTDACRAGKLAGSTVNGAQLTNANLAKPWNNEVKILSCQPNEFSIEGEQWGGGRGVFSYHLVEGLTGLADGNGDKAVNLMEIGRYLEERVPTEAAPHPQVPFTVGDRLATVAQVDADALALLEMDKSRQSTSFKTTGMRGLGDALLSKGDSAMYQAFLAALDSGNLLEPAGNCADDYYRQLVKVEGLRPVWGLMRRNFAAALQDEVQQALNALMESDPYEVNHWRFNAERYSRYPVYLARSLELVGENHYLYKTLLARKLYFEAYALMKQASEESDPVRRDSFRLLAKAKLLDALRLEPSAAYLYHAIGFMHFNTVPYQSDSLFITASKPTE
ncbi:MAG: caspase family protein [Saprospiraceae bacterium]|nr:caspase family protein [Saprospiraceae bacterium]